MNDTSSFLKNFPSKFEPRQIQKDIISQIETAVNSGYKKIILCAPTGIGKSYVAITIARSLGSSFIITAQKILQNQYSKDFDFIYPMKGKSNFPCLDLYDYTKMSYEEASNDKRISCSMGNCKKVRTIGGKKKDTLCDFKPNLLQLSVHNQGTEYERVSEPSGLSCYYYVQKYQALRASHAVFNYSSYFQTKKYSSGLDQYLEKDCIIADEAHEIEDQIIEYIGYEITSNLLRDVRLDFTDFALDDIDGVINMTSFLADQYHSERKKLQDVDEKDVRIPIYERRCEDLDSITTELKRNPQNMLYQKNLDFVDQLLSITIKPIEISDYTSQFFDTPFQIFMSATINKERFCNTMGIQESDCQFLEIPRSPFDLKNRVVHYYNIKRLNVRSTPEDYLTVYNTIDDILSRHSNEKGLILTTTKKHCREIYEHCKKHSSRLKIVHNDVEEKKDEILKAHAQTDTPSVLLSPSLWYGVDLPDDLSRFQIILKTPYLSFVDKRIKTKAQNDGIWYKYTALVKLLQGLGRSVRNENDYCVTYILDSTAQELVSSMKKFIPKSYHDSLELSPA